MFWILLVGLGCDRHPAHSLDDPDPGERERALNHLDKEDVQLSLDEVLSIWEDDADPTVRARALSLLALTSDARVMAPLKQALQSENSLFVQTAINGLANFGSQESCQVLASAYVAWPDGETETLALMAEALRIYNPACHPVVEGFRASHPVRVAAVFDDAPAPAPSP